MGRRGVAGERNERKKNNNADERNEYNAIRIVIVRLMRFVCVCRVPNHHRRERLVVCP